MNINAGIDPKEPSRFFLVTGGETTNTDTLLWKTMELADAAKLSLPGDLTEIVEKKE